jgi:hypothetical protein
VHRAGDDPGPQHDLPGQKVFWDPQTDSCFAWYADESSPPMPANPFDVQHSLVTGAPRDGRPDIGACERR